MLSKTNASDTRTTLKRSASTGVAAGLADRRFDGNGVIADAAAINGGQRWGKMQNNMKKHPDSRAKSAAGARSGGQQASNQTESIIHHR